MNDILTIDNLLHTLLGIAILGAAMTYPPAAVASALYLREQGQSGSWTLKWSWHKHAEWIVPSLVVWGIWALI